MTINAFYFKGPVSLEPKPDLKIVRIWVVYPVKRAFTINEIMDDVIARCCTRKWKGWWSYRNGFWIDSDGKKYPKDGDYIRRYIQREYDNTGFEYAVGNVRLHSQNRSVIGNLIVDRALYNRILQFIDTKDWVTAGTEKGDTE